MTPRPFRVAVVFIAVACGGEPTGPIGLDPGTNGGFQHSFSDPVGDTLPPPVNVLNRALDVEGLDVGLTAESIFVRIRFTSPISRWSSMSLNSIDGFIDFDFDDNPNTGYISATEEFGGVNAQMGVETYVSLRDDGAGQMLRRVGDTQEWREVRVQFSERTFTVRFARADVGENDGVFRISAMIGGTNREITDLVPGNGHYRVR
jgi:hypothetical protein